MHHVLFSVKRTFHKSTWFGRSLLTPYGLTPSRFDVLYIVRKHPHRFVWQSRIRKILGVAAPTASILVRALASLGLLRRRKSEWDSRQVEVSLTRAGRKLIERAMGTFCEKKIADYFVNRIVSSTWWDADQAFMDVDRLSGILRFMRSWLKDRATLAYPTGHPDDS